MSWHAQKHRLGFEKWNDWTYVFLAQTVLRTSEDLSIFINPWNARAFSGFSEVTREILKKFVIHWVHLAFLEIWKSFKSRRSKLENTCHSWDSNWFLEKYERHQWKIESICHTLKLPCFLFWNHWSHHWKFEKISTLCLFPCLFFLWTSLKSPVKIWKYLPTLELTLFRQN